MPNVSDQKEINKIHFENFTEVLVDEVIDDLFEVPTLGVC